MDTAGWSSIGCGGTLGRSDFGVAPTWWGYRDISEIQGNVPQGFAERPRVVRRCGQNQHAVASNEGHEGDAHSGQLLTSIGAATSVGSSPPGPSLGEGGRGEST